eukprot:TRINITY_DN34462_c0_g1_i1.p1 TRINITY_DN34462_c0_g1~~TRINITY_DN34462_c0_g1_i1.p1  ORF type:complete len:830 (-),score=268.04 TRINITY_DN34462_c0_g1_i1:176-2665(-)
MINLTYCQRNTSLSSVLTGELSLCFIDTVTDPLLLLVALAAGLHQWRLYRKFSTPVEVSNIRPSKLFLFQILFQILLPLISLSHFLLAVLGYKTEVTGVMVLTLVTSITCWTISTILTSLERYRQLPISARHGHGPVLLIFWTLAFMQVNFRFIVLTKEAWYDNLMDVAHKVDLGLFVSNYLLTCGVFVLGLRAPGLTPTHQYSNFRQENQEQEVEVESASEGSTWKGFWSKLIKLLPYMWPKNSPLLQLRVLACILLIVLLRVTNVFVPIYYKNIVNCLTTLSQDNSWPWVEVLLWVGLKMMQGGGMGQGLLNNLRSYLWITVQQFTTLEIQVGLFQHLHNLSLRWHTSRKTGEVLRVMDRGTNSINSLMQYLVFSILPTIADIIIAIVYLGVALNIWFGLIILVTMVMYLASTIIITEWRTKFRRKMNTADNDQRTTSVDSLLNAETVKYFSMEAWEVTRYKDTILRYQVEEWKSSASMILLNVFQGFVMNGGFLGIALYCAYLVSERELTVGDFVMLGTYFQQLMGPLNWLGTLYRVIQESFINMENMFDLLNEKVEVADKLKALTFVKEEASPEIKFDNVDFSYDPAKSILKGVTFNIPSGTTTAIVGSSGSGKTTIGKLLVRMYDAKEGAITFNGVNVSDYTQSSLRKSIGVVPQDTVLFNDTIRYNIRYGRMEATDGEVEEAARLADIHSAILGFPDGYDTVVGERGLKLSGGEKQRVAIARTLLKQPGVMLYDEATSSLDSTTERNIQEAIIAASNRKTVLVIAHRLSTVVNSEQIIVMDQGEVVEKGSHQELVEMNGKYKELWEHQQNSKDGGKDTVPSKD